jgi:glucose/arabinose dehydrogenase
MKTSITAFLFLLFFICISSVNAQTNPNFYKPGFSSQYEVYDAGNNNPVTFQFPVGLRFNSDGNRMFVWEKAGKVFVCNWSSSENRYIRQNTPVVDITEEVGNFNDMAFLGFALDPNFSSNGLIYCMYVVDQHHLLHFGTPQYNPNTTWNFHATIGRITRYQTEINGNGELVINPSTRTILLGQTASTGIPILYDSHGVGDMEFGSDGTLLISCGDAASYSNTDVGANSSDSYNAEALQLGIITAAEDVGAFRSQMLTSYCGKILRIDPVTGNGITSNPFYDQAAPGSVKSKIWALGLRNPYRFSIKPNTGSLSPESGDPGTLYISDVGWITYEELNVCDKPGQNFGWPIYEGIFKTGSFSGQQAYGNRSTRNMEQVNPLAGGGCNQYFRFRDLIKDPTPDNNDFLGNPCNTSQQIPPLGPLRRFVHKRPLLEWKHGATDVRVPVFNGNQPVAAFINSPESGVTGDPFSGYASIGGVFYTGDKYLPEYTNTFFMTDYENKLMNLSFVLDNTLSEVIKFADGDFTSLCMEQNPRDGLIYYVSVRDPDNSESNEKGRIRKLVYGGNIPPVAKIRITNNNGNNYGPSSLTLDFSSSDSYDPDLAGLTYQWDFGDGFTSNEANPTHTFNGNGQQSFTVTLTVSDGQAQTSASMVVSLNNTPPSAQIVTPVNNGNYIVGQVTSYTAAANVSDAQTPNNQLTYSWQTVLRHNSHEHSNSPVSGQSPQIQVGGEGSNQETFYYLIRLTVTDPFGLSKTDSVKIYPEGSSLPVTLLSFSGAMQNHHIRLTWKTTNESFIERYEVERSADGRGFSKIGQHLPKDGNGTGIKEYNLFDTDPLPGKAYYRLKVVHVDGTYEYSSGIHFTVTGLPSKEMKVYPVPFTDNLVLETYFREAGKIQVQLIDMKGRIILTRNEIVTEGTRIISIGGLDNLIPGLYHLNILQKGELRRIKVVKMVK